MLGNVDGIDNDQVMGWALEPDDPSHRVQVDVFYNDRPLSRTLAAFHRPDLEAAGIGDGTHGFYVALPALKKAEKAVVSAVFTETGEPIGVPVHVNRRPKCSRAGLLAADMLQLQPIPLYSLQGIDFNAQHVVLSGFHLPPGGNPSELAVRSTAGTVFDVEYPLHSPDVAGYYWYWPNAQWSGFRITIDLPASSDEGKHFEFWFDTGSDDPTHTALERNRVSIPKDLRSYQNFPHGDNQLSRVMHFDLPNLAAMAGYTDYRRLAHIAAAYGVDLPNAHVLDWGCGHGRVIRHFVQQGQARQAYGVDIDAENTLWLRDNLAGVDASVVPLLPPTDLPSEHFDFVYAISVMTHLSRDVQQRWLAELKRITKPGGLVVLTFDGPSAVAFASRSLEPEHVTLWAQLGFDDSQSNDDLVGKIAEPGYYRNTKQSAEVTREMWGRQFTVLDIHPAVFGYQDIAVMRA